MALAITHSTVATFADEPGAEINKAEWNAAHTLTGSIAWGEITGTLSNQTDLQTALGAKQGTITLTTTGNSGAATLIADALNIPQYASTSSQTFTGTGSATSADASTQPALFTGGGSPTAGNLYGIAIIKTGFEEAFLGINKNTTTGSIPSSSVYLSTYLSNGQISIGRGNGAGLPNSADILINGSGNVSMPNALTAASFNGVALTTGGSASKFLNEQGNYVVSSGSGDVVGPAASVDNEVPRFDSTTGKIIQQSGLLIDDSKNLCPITTDVGALGTTSLNWADLFLDSGAVINWDSGDVTETHSANTLTWAGATSGYKFQDGPITPVANDGIALGTASLSFSDGFWASGAVQNYANGNVTETHSSGRLTLAGEYVVTSSSATAFSVGPAGATNPCFIVIASTASADNGLGVTGGTGGVALDTVSNDSNGSISIKSKGASDMTIGTPGNGDFVVQTGGANRFRILSAGAQFAYTPNTSSTAATSRFLFTGASDTSLTGGAEAPNWYINLAQTRQHASNTAISLQRDIRFSGSTHSYVTSGGVITNCAVLSVDSFGQAGTNSTITSAHGLYIPTQAAAGTVTNMYGITVAAPTGGGTKNLAINASGLSEIGTIQNTRINPRVVSTASSATPTPDADVTDEYILTALAAGATFGAPTGTPVQGQAMIFRIIDNGGAQTLAFNAIYRAIGVTLPTTTVAGKLTYIAMIYNSTSTKWDVINVAQEA